MNEQTGHDEFLRLFSQNSNRIFEFISTLVFNPADADDIFQSTCVVLWKKFDTYDPEGSFRAWACKIAYYEMLQLRRKSKRLQAFSDEVLELLAEDMLRRSSQLQARQLALADCIAKLTSQDRELLEQRYYHQIPPREIASTRPGSVYKVYRALTRIHTLLRECVGRTLAGE